MSPRACAIAGKTADVLARTTAHTSGPASPRAGARAVVVGAAEVMDRTGRVLVGGVVSEGVVPPQAVVATAIAVCKVVTS